MQTQRKIYRWRHIRWNAIKPKTEFLNEFQQLKEKRSKFSYEMIFGRTEKEMVEAVKKL